MAEVEGQGGEALAVVETAPPAEASAPVAETPAVEEAPAVEEIAAVAEEAPAAEEAVAEEAPAEAIVEEAPAAEPSAEEAKPAEPEPPTYEPFEMPEGVTLADEDVGELATVFGKYRLTQEAAQELATFGAERIKRGVEQMQKHMAEEQHEVFAATRHNWVREFEKQAGNQRNTILDDAKSAIKDAVPDEKQRAQVWEVLNYTGAGDHPAIINLMAAIGKRNREGKAPGPSLASSTSGTPADRRYAQRG